MSQNETPLRRSKLGPFELGEIIGSGGFGTVYRASAPGGDAVAVKVLAPHVDSEEMLSRFEREASIRIEHPNVVRVVDAGRDDGVSYIAFELLEGEPLNKRLQRAPLPVEEVRDLAVQMCAGLSAAHERGVIHRDLKPGNVFVCHGGRVKVLDFGIARPMGQAGPQLTMAGSVIGTPGYLSPEQAKGDVSITPAADLWALGVILYQALSGRNPFMRATAVATILAVVLEDAPPLGDQGEALPPGVAEIVHRCLRKDPAERWESAEAVARAVMGLDLEASAIVGVPESLAPSIPVDEQRLVALLFATEVQDLPELAHVVKEWGGELTPMLGGQAIAVFGGRMYEGDEALRAVQAALAARSAAGYVAVAVGRATSAAGTVSGDAVSAVERACEAKLVGVAIDAAAARSLAGAFPLRPAADGLFEVPRDVRMDSTGSFPALREDLPLLGREGELARLEHAEAHVFEGRHAGAAWVTGPPGIGKSRLRAEVERRLRKRGVSVLVGRAESHRRDVAYHLLATVLRSEPTLEPFFLNPAVPDERRRDALAVFCGQVLEDATWAAQVTDPIARLLGLPEPTVRASSPRRSDPQLMADRLRVALADLFTALATRGPLAIILDDAQWADEASLSFLDDLLARVATRPFFLFIAARPQLGERHPELFAEREMLKIEPRGLDRVAVATVAAAIADRALPAALVDEITQRTGGNPFFVEQIVRELVDRNLLDSELDRLPIPVDVEGAVQSRLDHLPPSEKQLCKRAAVLAAGFDVAALEALEQPSSERLLGSLSKRGLISSRGVAADEQGRVYRFKNALVRDVAYRMNSEEARRELHRLAAAFLRTQPGVDQEVLAHHLDEGGESEPAAAAYAAAASAAARRGDSRSALRCSARALELGVDANARFELEMVRVDALSFLGDREAQAQAVEAALAAASGPAQRARAFTEQAALAASVHAPEGGMEPVEQAVELAREAGDPDILAGALARRGWLLLYAGRIAEAAESIGEASRMTDSLSPDVAALVAAWRAQLVTAMGDLGKRKHAYEDAVARFRALGDHRRAASAECNLADTLNRVGAYEEAEHELRDAVTACRRVGNRVVEGYALANLGYSLGMQGRLDEALEAFDHALALAEETGRPRLAIAARVYRARAMLDHAPPGDVVEAAEVAAREAEQAGLPALCASARSVVSRARLAAGDAEGALEDARRAMASRDEVGTMEEDEAEVFLALALALEANGLEAEAREITARGASRLEFLAGRIADVDWRARFLVEVPVNRALIELDGR